MAKSNINVKIKYRKLANNENIGENNEDENGIEMA